VKGEADITMELMVQFEATLTADGLIEDRKMIDKDDLPMDGDLSAATDEEKYKLTWKKEFRDKLGLVKDEDTDSDDEPTSNKMHRPAPQDHTFVTTRRVCGNFKTKFMTQINWPRVFMASQKRMTDQPERTLEFVVDNNTDRTLCPRPGVDKKWTKIQPNTLYHSILNAQTGRPFGVDQKLYKVFGEMPRNSEFSGVSWVETRGSIRNFICYTTKSGPMKMTCQNFEWLGPSMDKKIQFMPRSDPFGPAADEETYERILSQSENDNGDNTLRVLRVSEKVKAMSWADYIKQLEANPSEVVVLAKKFF
jgi:hypothetical protein